MGLFTWIIFGALAGWIASKLMGRGRTGLFTKIILGVVGSSLGGWLSTVLFNGDGVTGFDWRSMLVAVCGACLLLTIFRNVGRKD